MSGVFLILYGISRFTVDFFRYYESQMQVGFLYLNQVISVCMIAGGMVIFWQLGSRVNNMAKAQ